MFETKVGLLGLSPTNALPGGVVCIFGGGMYHSYYVHGDRRVITLEEVFVDIFRLLSRK
jgi:hypothetical protein